jgi:hypothetical protein
MVQDMIDRRGQQAGAQVVSEANARAEREERLMREAEAAKAAADAKRMAADKSARAARQAAATASRRAQQALKADAAQAEAAEVKQFVAEVHLLASVLWQAARWDPLLSLHLQHGCTTASTVPSM